MGKIYNVNFQTKSLESIEEAETKEERLDPVLERIKSKMDEKSFDIFKKTVDTWMQECFLYEMEQRNKTEN